MEFNFTSRIFKFRDFKSFSARSVINESTGQPINTLDIANSIQNSVGGLGTDEKKFLEAIRSIGDLKTLEMVNKIMSSSPKFSYRDVQSAITGELGLFDLKDKQEAQNHLRRLKQSEANPKIDPIISSILERVKKHEGVKFQRYLDSRGIPTVGVGFNLNRKDADEKLKKIGLNSAKVKKGSQKLTPQQAENLLILDLENALAGARRILGPSATNMSEPALGVLTEMVFNLGTTGVLKFDSFLKYFKIKKFKRAASEMLRSRWAKQVGERARNLAEILKKLGT
jgi:lysozyme